MNDAKMLPDGVLLFELTENHDRRGSLMELYRSSQGMPIFPQLNYVRSEAGVLRGVHVHPHHADYVTVLSGTLILGLHDIRRQSPSFGASFLTTLDSSEPVACFIPVGVAHGFYLPSAATYLYALSEEWSPGGDFGCRWDDRALGIDWPVSDEPMLSERDRNAPSFDDMVARFEAALGERAVS